MLSIDSGREPSSIPIAANVSSFSNLFFTFFSGWNPLQNYTKGPEVCVWTEGRASVIRQLLRKDQEGITVHKMPTP